jgi:hypothetical protein
MFFNQYNGFTEAPRNFRFGLGNEIDDFVSSCNPDVLILRVNENSPISNIIIQQLSNFNKFVVALSKTTEGIAVREIRTESDVETPEPDYIVYLAIPRSKRDEFIDTLDGIENFNHSLAGSSETSTDLCSIYMPPLMDYSARIDVQANGNSGAKAVLSQLLEECGQEVFDTVAPQLGTGFQIWVKFKDECNEDVKLLVEKYMPKS